MWTANSYSVSTLLLLSALNLVYIFSVLSARREAECGNTTGEPEYTWRGHDFPETLPIPGGKLSPVAVRVKDESAHYPLRGLASDEPWANMSSSSWGYVRLGPENRMFIVSMYHQMHCLRMLNLAFEPTGFEGTKNYIHHSHLKHCLDYLRQSIQCSSDVTLERGDFEQQITESSMEDQKTIYECRNWSQLEEVMENNWQAWILSSTETGQSEDGGPGI